MSNNAGNDLVTTVGIDLGKNTFHICGMNQRGAIVLKERLSRAKLPKGLVNIDLHRVRLNEFEKLLCHSDHRLALGAIGLKRRPCDEE